MNMIKNTTIMRQILIINTLIIIIRMQNDNYKNAHNGKTKNEDNNKNHQNKTQDKNKNWVQNKHNNRK